MLRVPRLVEATLDYGMKELRDRVIEIAPRNQKWWTMVIHHFF
jgi:hypothetical protein